MQFLRYLYARRNQVFFDFSKYLRNQRFSKSHEFFFQVLLSTIFYKMSGTFNETFLTLSSLACITFSKSSWFLFIHKPQVEKSVDVISCLFYTAKKKKTSEVSRLIVGYPTPFPALSFSKGLVCALFIYTIFIRIIWVSQEELSLIGSNEQIYHFYN